MRRSLTTALILLLMMVSAPDAASAAGPAASQTGKVAVVVIDWISLSQLRSNDAFNGLVEEGAIGVVSSPIQGEPTPYRYYLALGAGNIAGGLWWPETARNVDELMGNGVTAATRWAALSGLPTPQQGVVELDVFQAQRAQEGLPFGPVPGRLGEVLKEQGKVVGVIGNADTADISLRSNDPVLDRSAVLMAMDANGRVPLGDVSSNLTRRNPSYLPGIQNSRSDLLVAARSMLDKVDVLFVQLGETSRVAEYRNVASGRHVTRLRNGAIDEAALMIRELQDIMGPGGRIMAVTPTPPRRGNGHLGMPPIFVIGDGIEAGLVSSPTTRRPGVVGNVDIGATVLAWTGADQPNDLPGRPIDVDQSSGLSVVDVIDIETTSAWMFITRPWLLGLYLLGFLVLFLGASVNSLMREREALKRTVLSWGGLSLLAAPTVFLLIAKLWKPEITTAYFFRLFVGMLLLAAIARLMSRFLRPVLLLAGLALIIPIVDAIMGSSLMFDSPLGYSPLYGARFYGIGNETMAVMIAALFLIGVNLLKDVKILRGLRGTLMLGGGLLVLLIMFGHPAIGTNVGGTITLAVAGTIAIFLWRGGRLGALHLLAAFGVAAVVLGVLTVLDIGRADIAQSHLGQTGELVASSGFLALVPIVLRRLVAGLSASADWAVPFALLIGAAITSIKVQTGVVARLTEEYPLLKGALTAVIIAGVLGLLVNDSGIIIPALMLPYFMTGVLIIGIESARENETELQDEPGELVL